MYEVGKPEVKAATLALMSKQYFRYGGTEVSGFEEDWARLIGTRKAVAVTSGTGALICALGGLGVGPGDEVIVPVYTFISTALAVTSLGAIPVYAGVDSSLTLDPDQVKQKITSRTKCIIPVHMQGMPCNLKPLLNLAKRHKIAVLEDCCQAAGGSYQGKRLGTWGKAGAFSFNQFKIISCGEGGAVTTSDKKLAERVYMLQDGSCSVWPETGPASQAFFCAGNFRFNEINAAILRSQAKRLDSILKRLRKRRKKIISSLVPPEGCSWVESHDEEGNCGVCALLQCQNENTAKSIENKLKPIFDVHRPAESGRHIYSAWDVVNEGIGGHHAEWDCFRHPKNRDHLPNYKERFKESDRLLSNTVLIRTPYEVTMKDLGKMIKKAGKKL